MAIVVPEVTREELAAVLDAVAAETLAATDVFQPPVDAVRIAGRLGLTIAWDDLQTGRARLVHLAGSAAQEAASILVKHDPRHERLHWAVAHEVGETLADRVFRELNVDPREAPPQTREQIANGFASRLLLPTDWFAGNGAACGWDLFELKHSFATASHELIARRMLDFSPQVIIAVYDHDRLTWRKSNLPGRWPPPSRRELECRRWAHESSETVYDDGPPLIRVWPIHEPQWRREIVRIEIDEFAEI